MKSNSWTPMGPTKDRSSSPNEQFFGLNHNYVWGPTRRSAINLNSLRCRFLGSLGPLLSLDGYRRLIRLDGCPGWSETLLGARDSFTSFLMLWQNISNMSVPSVFSIHDITSFGFSGLVRQSTSWHFRNCSSLSEIGGISSTGGGGTQPTNQHWYIIREM